MPDYTFVNCYTRLDLTFEVKVYLKKKKNKVSYSIEGRILANGTANPPSNEPIEPNFLM